MSSSEDYLLYVLDLIREIENISYKKMMGEYLLYKDGVLFGGIYDNRLLIKKTKSFTDYTFDERLPYKGAKPMLLIDTEIKEELEDIITKVYNDLK